MIGYTTHYNNISEETPLSMLTQLAYITSEILIFTIRHSSKLHAVLLFYQGHGKKRPRLVSWKI